MKLYKKLALGLIGLLACSSLVGCESHQDKEADRENQESNQVSAYVNKHFNHGAIRGYTKQATFDKISGTVVFDANNYTTSQLKSKHPNETKTHVRRIVKHDMTKLAKSTGDRDLRVNIVPSKLDKVQSTKK